MSTQLGRDNLKLFETGELADVVIRCKDRIWRAHKQILVGRSMWFKRALTGNWVESVSGKIDVSEMNPNTMDAVLRYIYSGDLGIEVKSGNLCFEECAQQWIHADFFQLDPLKDDILECLTNNFLETSLGLWTIERRASNHSFPKTTSAKFWINNDHHQESFYTDLLKAVDLIYTVPGARKFQKLLTACIFALGTDFDAEAVNDSMSKSAEFKEDMLAVLVGMRFNQAFESRMRILHTGLLSEQAVHSNSVCDSCDEHLGPSKSGTTKQVTLDNFSKGDLKWCADCRKDGLDQQIKNLLSLL